MPVKCQICGFRASEASSADIGQVRGNTDRFSGKLFPLWKCPGCLTIYSVEPVDFAAIYADYPLNRRKSDVFARGTLSNLLRRLTKAGLKKHHAILDYGCGNGIFVQFLADRGYRRVTGYDPFVPEYAQPPVGPFDWVVNNDTIEHCDDVRAMIVRCVDLLKPGGFFYLGTADSEPVKMSDLEPHVMRLHQPFHRVIFTEATLHRLIREAGLELILSYRRSYLDTLRPFCNYRFLDELNKSLGHSLERALDPAASFRVVSRTPRLWFFAWFGYFFPSAAEPAVVALKPAQQHQPI